MVSSRCLRWQSVLLVLAMVQAGFAFAGFPCTNCHTLLKRAVKHEAAVTDCTACHVGHDEKYTGRLPSRLRNAVDPLCLGCHEKDLLRLGTGHIVARHPTYLPRDPMYEDRRDFEPREFNCVSCHNPHSSTMPKLFRFNYLKNESPYGGLLCNVCHDYGMPGEVPFPPVEGKAYPRRTP